MRFCTTTLGCKVNQFETQAIESILSDRGHEKAEAGEGCDVCIINTCAVTEESIRKSRQAVRRLMNREPEALIAVCGCFTQLDSSAVMSLGADHVGGSSDRRGFALEIEMLFEAKGHSAPHKAVGDAVLSIPQVADDCKPGKTVGDAVPSVPQVAYDCESGNTVGEVVPSVPQVADDCKPVKTVGDADPSVPQVADDCKPGKTVGDAVPSVPNTAQLPIEQEFEVLPVGNTGDRTRALLKIQDGCDNSCSYCVIPLVRGAARSLPPDLAAEHARQLGHMGFREIVITGIEISSYGKDIMGSPSLADAIREISAAVPNARLRLGSLDPGIITEAFCTDMSRISNLCRHFHISLQSGCDATLRRMGRKYETGTVFAMLGQLRRKFPGCGITADIITGFPGETETEFEQTIRFIRAAAFSDMHIFRFSPRPGTAAAEMPEQIPKVVRRDRARMLAKAAGEMSLEFKKSQIGSAVEVLLERKLGHCWTGHSGNYIEVTLISGGEKNSLVPVRLTELRGDLVWGHIID